MKLNGKAFRLFAATLVLTSQIVSASAVEGTEGKKAETLPPPAGSLYPSALHEPLPVIKIEKDETVLRGGKSVIIHEEILTAISSDPKDLEEFLHSQLVENAKVGGVAIIADIDGGKNAGAPENEGLDLEKATSGIPSDSIKAKKLPLPYELSKAVSTSVSGYFQRYGERYDEFRFGKRSVPNLALTVVKFVGFATSQVIFAVTLSHIPALAALPFALTVATMTASMQYFNLLMPFNDKKINTITKFAWFAALEYPFDLIGQASMAATNVVTDTFLHASYFDLLPWSSLVTTTVLALKSQAPFDIADYLIFHRYMDSIEKMRGTNPFVYQQKKQRAETIFNFVSFLVSITSVTLAFSRTYKWPHADMYFGWFIKGAVIYSVPVFLKIPERVFALVTGRPQPPLNDYPLVEKCRSVFSSLKIKYSR